MSEAPPITWMQDLTGQVFDPASLTILWSELTSGAYGAIQHVKAIVEIVDGSAWQLTFEQGEAPTETELPLERWLTGRPNRPSQIEIVADDLNIPSLLQTISDCCLSDAMLENYQIQLRSEASSTG